MKKYITGLILAAFICSLLTNIMRAQAIQQGIAGRVLRFHVLADSDSVEDQERKLAVRDAVGSYLGTRLAGAKSLDESSEIAAGSLSQIEEVARNVLLQTGCSDPVRASLEQCVFPEKTYGACTFPAGRYEALRVVIGSGAGHNWWCVMYPNLCFAGSLYERPDEAAPDELSVALTADELRAVVDGGEMEVRSAFLDALRELLE